MTYPIKLLLLLPLALAACGAPEQDSAPPAAVATARRAIGGVNDDPCWAILREYSAHGGPSGILGAATGSCVVYSATSVAYQDYQYGSIYWSPSTGAHEVHGAIRDKWAWYGWDRSFLGLPLTSEITASDGIGRYNHFQNGSIFWSPSTGAHEVHGAIRDRWFALGWERFGYPTTDETAGTPSPFDGSVGRYNEFRASLPSGAADSTIYWHNGDGAHAIYGVIRAEWVRRGREVWTVCGGTRIPVYPTGEEQGISGYGPGARAQQFTRTGIIWTPTRGVWATYGCL